MLYNHNVKISSHRWFDLIRSTAMGLNLQKELEPFGIASAQLLQFDRGDFRLSRYLDLTPESALRKRQTGIPLPQGVVEYEGRPILYVIRGDSLAQPQREHQNDVARLVRTLVCRADGGYLAVVGSGELVVYPLKLTAGYPKGFAVSGRDDRAPMLVPDLVSGFHLDQERERRQAGARAEALHRLLFKLLTGVSTALRESGALSSSKDNDQVLPLVGRALFARFLIDRGIINPDTFPQLYEADKPEECFGKPELAALTCAWLDDKFNGELLPMFGKEHPEYDDYLAFFRAIHSATSRVLHEVSNILYRAPDGSLMLDLDWNGIDFAHVPIGLLSEVYEDYAHKFYKSDAERESVRFTPRDIAEFTVDQAFSGLAPERRHTARLLDPAAGAGIFLVLGFRRLVAERWKVAGRPNTKEIRDILREQVRGFDINGSALTLAALSLYLTALELDAEPYPPEKLRFEKLQGTVLFNMRQEHESFPYDEHVLGSLGPLGGKAEHLNAYDIVIGNPPWTAWKGEAGRQINTYVSSMANRIIEERPQEGKSGAEEADDEYEHNDNLPDVAFLWRAMEWAKRDDAGVIALIVHGRLLFKRAAKGVKVRDALFRSVHVTGILNGAELTPMWPSLNQPFCIVFARNESPTPGSRFRFVTPALDNGTGGRYRMRFDYDSSQPVDLAAVQGQPYLLKSLFRGGTFDVSLVGRLVEMTLPTEVEVEEEDEEAAGDEEPVRSIRLLPPRAVTIGDIWNTTVGGLAGGQGFMPGSGQKTTELVALRGKQLTKEDSPGLRIECRPLKLEQFTATSLHRRRKPEIYRPPLVLLSEGFGESKETIRSRIYLEEVPLIYSRNFYGLSTAGHPDSVLLAKYLFVLTSSDLFAYFMLQTSAKLGVERRTIFMEDIKAFPIIPIEQLSSIQRKTVARIADFLSLSDNRSWTQLNRWVADLYELTDADRQVVEDTLATRMPYESSRDHALAEATVHELEAFRKSVEDILGPFFTGVGESLTVTPIDLPSRTWVAFDITSNNQATARPFDSMVPLATALGNQEGISRIFFETEERRLRVAIRNQYRYLTKTRARLCALDVIRGFGHVFPLEAT
jgi:hypothetical protein